MEKKYSFGPFVLQMPERHLFRKGKKIPLLELQMELLVFFVRNPDRLISYEELLQTFWPNKDVGEETMKKAVRLLARQLGDTRKRQVYIQNAQRPQFAAAGGVLLYGKAGISH
jgi:DNA-binding winged helix-turn-helix (wHTH) protein